MSNMTLDLSALAQIPDLVSRLEKGMALIEGKNPVWIDLKRACAMKGVNFNTTRANMSYQPRLGAPDTMMHGRKHWRAETIREWLDVTDENRPGYIQKCMGNSK